jgi:HD superfamily phosphohydrolase
MAARSQRTRSHRVKPQRTKVQGGKTLQPAQLKQKPRPQRIRDPLHNLIEFGTDQFEDVVWRVIQTRPFQRLRRVKQLGFSELVYPGATHTRFAHSVGVFHTARHLMRIIERHIKTGGHHFRDHQAHVALAAALVHDLGHGMFSHAFEDVGKKLSLTMAEHDGEIETFILGPKAYYAAETYVLALFQLYPTVYFHKATRAAEKLFSVMMLRIVSLVREGRAGKTGLPLKHPMVRFAKDPESLDNALALDDAVFWGALSMLADAEDKQIRDCAIRLRDRKLPKCIDIRHELVSAIGLSARGSAEKRDELKKRLERLIGSIEKQLERWVEGNSDDSPRILLDRAVRDPYKRFQESKGPLNQIHIRLGDKIFDVAESSSVVAGIETFELFRAYVTDTEAKSAVEKIVKDELRR